MREIRNLFKTKQEELGIKETPLIITSIDEQLEFAESNAYTKLVKNLKDRMKYFDTPLEN
jgi:hypothetical protein